MSDQAVTELADTEGHQVSFNSSPTPEEVDKGENPTADASPLPRGSKRKRTDQDHEEEDATTSASKRRRSVRSEKEAKIHTLQDLQRELTDFFEYESDAEWFPVNKLVHFFEAPTSWWPDFKSRQQWVLSLVEKQPLGVASRRISALHLDNVPKVFGHCDSDMGRAVRILVSGAGSSSTPDTPPPPSLTKAPKALKVIPPKTVWSMAAAPQATRDDFKSAIEGIEPPKEPHPATIEDHVALAFAAIQTSTHHAYDKGKGAALPVMVHQEIVKLCLSSLASRV